MGKRTQYERKPIVQGNYVRYKLRSHLSICVGSGVDTITNPNVGRLSGTAFGRATKALLRNGGIRKVRQITVVAIGWWRF